jgi:hypothetical protein
MRMQKALVSLRSAVSSGWPETRFDVCAALDHLSPIRPAKRGKRKSPLPGL